MAKRDEKKATPACRQLLETGDFRAARTEAQRALNAAPSAELRAEAEAVLVATQLDSQALLAAGLVLAAIATAAAFGLFR